MIGWILAGVIGAIVAAGVTVAVVSKIDKEVLKEKMNSENIKKAIISKINKSTNRVKLEDLESGKTLEVQGDEISDDLYESDIITV